MKKRFAPILTSLWKVVHLFLILMVFTIISFLLCKVAFGNSLTLAWDANAESALAGYKIYYNNVSRNNPFTGKGIEQGASPITVELEKLSAPNKPSFQLSSLSTGKTYFFTVTAYNSSSVESDFSNIISYNVNSPTTVLHKITTSKTGNGNIDPAESIEKAQGTKQTYTISAEVGYLIADVTVDGISVGPLHSYTFESITQNHSIEAIFAREPQAFRMETGQVTVNNKWLHVTFDKNFVDPVVIASALSTNDNDPAIIRIDRVTPTGFDICLQEWDYLDDQHDDEKVGYIAMEAGSHRLPDGTLVEAGIFDTQATGTFTNVSFCKQFSTPPILVTSINSFKEPDAVASVIRNITTTTFEYQMQEQEANAQLHNTETVSYIAWEPSNGNLDGVQYEIGRTNQNVNHSLKNIPFGEAFNTAPVFVAAMQTKDESDTASIRWGSVTPQSFQVKVEEEQSNDPEQDHDMEVLGYMAFASQSAPMDSHQKNNINTISDKYIYVMNDFELHVIDVNDSNTPVLLGNVYVGYVEGLTVSDNYAYMAVDYGLQVVDVRDPKNPVAISYIAMPDWTTSVTVSGNYAYVVGFFGLQVIDIRDPNDPVIIGSINTAWVNHITVSGNYAYLAVDVGLQIIDVSNPSNPVIISSVETSWANHITVSGNYAYMAVYYGLEIVDIADPNNPAIISFVDAGYAKHITVVENYAYVATDNGLQIIDIIDPKNPIILGSIDTQDQAYGVTLSGNYAYVAGGYSGLLPVDISNPKDPVVGSSIDNLGNAFFVTSLGN
jgi:hypothetical protein